MKDYVITFNLLLKFYKNIRKDTVYNCKEKEKLEIKLERN